MIDDWQICNGNIDIIKIEKVSLGKNSKIKLKERIKETSKKNRLRKKNDSNSDSVSYDHSERNKEFRVVYYVSGLSDNRYDSYCSAKV